MLVNKKAKLSETVNIYICLRMYMKLKEHETKANTKYGSTLCFEVKQNFGPKHWSYHGRKASIRTF